MADAGCIYLQYFDEGKDFSVFLIVFVVILIWELFKYVRKHERKLAKCNQIKHGKINEGRRDGLM